MSRPQLETDIVHYTVCPWCSSENLIYQFKTPDRSGSGESYPICKCQNCKFVFTQDVPGPKSIAPYYQFEEYISHSDTQNNFTDKIYHSVRTYMLKKKFRIIERHKMTQGKSILDYGCGTGYFLNTIQQYGWETQGVEIDAGAREHAINKFNLVVHAPDAFEEVKGPFDVITLWHVLEHLYDFKEKIQCFHDMLKQDGLLILALPNHDALDAQILKEHWAAYDTPRHLWHFNPKIIRELAEKYNFTYVKSQAMPFDAFYVSMLSYQIKKDNLFALVKGGFVGLLSNINSTFAPQKSSSLIYILRKK